MVTLTFETLTLELPNPDMGNTFELDFTRISRATPGGDTIIYRDNQWPKSEKLTVSFQILDLPTARLYEQMDKIKYFIRRSLGKECQYTDHNGVEWTVLILNPNTAIKQPTIYSYSLVLELEATQ